MKKLPKVFQNEISKNINNNKKVCYLKEENKNISDPITSNQTITDTLDEIFSGLGYSYNIPVIMIYRCDKTFSCLTCITSLDAISILYSP